MRAARHASNIWRAVLENGPADEITQATSRSIAASAPASSTAATRASTPSRAATASTFARLRPATIGASPRSFASAASSPPV